jgi:F-box/leucine-rich repeat protein 2/20
MHCTIPLLLGLELPDLQMLHLYDFAADTRTLCQLISSCPSLCSFHCDNIQGSDDCLDALAEHCPLLQVLAYEKGNSTEVSSLVHLMDVCPDIEVVDISTELEGGNPSATDAHIAAIMQHCQHPKVFASSGGTDGTTGASELLVATRAQELRHLCLYDCALTSEAPLLALAPQCGNLLTLDLASRTEDFSQAALTTLASSLTSTVEFRIADCEVGDSVLQEVGAHCSSLQSVHLDYCGGYTEVRIAALARGCKELRVVHASEDDVYLPRVAKAAVAGGPAPH